MGAALEERTRDRMPLDWARRRTTSAPRSRRWASGTARLEEAVTANRVALEERTQELTRRPLNPSFTKGVLYH